MKNKLFSTIVILSLVLGLLLSARPLQRARAAGITCYVDDTALGSNNGIDWLNAYRDLQLALNNPDCTTIDVAEGMYHPTIGDDKTISFQLRSGLEMNGGFQDGGETRNPYLYESILSGDLGILGDQSDNSYHVITGNNLDSATILDGFTIQDGYAYGDSPYDSGGGIYLTNSGPTLQNLVIQNNAAASDGGGMFDIGNTNLYDVLFMNNQAVNDGGGLYISSGAVTITHSQFRSNWAGSTGGGLCVYGTVNMSDSVVNINTAGDEGGGIALPSTDSSGTFINLLLNYNQVSAESGYGGGVYTYGAPSTMFVNTLFFDNYGANGGAMANFGGSAPIITNATIVGNWASNYGDVFYNYEANPILINTIFWTNEGSVPDNPDIFNADVSSVTTISHSIVPGSCPAGASCSYVVTSDPLFIDSAAHRFELQPTSPAIDAGDNSAVPTGVLTDLDGRPRFTDVTAVPDSGIGPGPIVDLGAFEAHYGTPYTLYVDQNGPSALIGDGNSWATAYSDLKTALFTAYAGDQIWVAEGTYYSYGKVLQTFQLDNDVAVYGGYPSGGNGQRDPVAHETILDGRFCAPDAETCSYSYHVVTASDVDASTVLDGFTITNGRADGTELEGLGGGIFISNGSPTLQNLVIQYNEAPIAGGGGMYLSQGSPTLTNVIFSSNSALSGGGFFADGSPVLKDVDFSNNSAMGGVGGGMYSTSGNPDLTDVTFTSNTSAANGAGLAIFSDNATMRNCQFIENRVGAMTACGGGLYVSDGSVNIINSVFKFNSAGQCGGGLAFYNSSGTFVNLTVSSNIARLGTGGGIYTYSSSPAVFTNLSLINNNAGMDGGGGMTNDYSDPNITNATIAGNFSTTAGSAILNNQSHPMLANSIVWGNMEQINGPDIFDSSVESQSTIVSTILQEGCPSSANCTNVISGDPQFIDPSTGNYHLQLTSPAVDAGDNSALPADIFDLNGNGNTSETIPYDLDGKQRIVLGQVDLGTFEVQVPNTSWTTALDLQLEETQAGVSAAQVDQALGQQDESRWYKFIAQPDSKLIVTLTELPANYDLALFTDIAQAFQQLNTPQDLVQLSAEFAPDTFSPDTFSPDTFSPDTFSPDTFSPDTFSPDTFSPDTFSPDTFSPDTFSPDTFSPDTFSPDTFSPDTFSPDTFSPDTFSPDTFSPDTFSPDTFSPDTFSSAQTRSLITGSNHEGTLGEGIMINTWTKSGYFYIRVRGRNGVFNPGSDFHLQVMQLTGSCDSVSPLLPPSNTSLPSGDYHTLILTNPNQIEGTPEEKTTLQTNLLSLATATQGWVVNVGADQRVSAAAAQAETNPICVYAKNLEAYAVKDLVDAFRAENPLEYIVLIGNDQSIPFFRYPDNALLASETGYSPPVKNDTTSQASLKMGYFLTQDTYGASVELSILSQTMPMPDLAVGRLVETASNINEMLEAYLSATNGVVSPTNALVTGYDFLADTANAVDTELTASLGASNVDALIMDNTLSPEDPTAWTATDLQNYLLGNPHDLVFLAGHFSASSALAADYTTRLTTDVVASSDTDFTNSLVYSAGCHSGYNIVDAHDVTNVTREPDWAQMFNSKGATFIGGTGYQYGDTDFIKYSELLYLDFTRQLRYGSGPVAVGEALVKAKQAFLAETPEMRGIHWKSLLEATLFGLPMFQEDLPNRISPPLDTTIVPSASTFSTDPGLQLGLEYADISLSPTINETNVDLDVISSAGGEPTQVTATYLEGPDGVVVNPAEPVLPLDLLNVTHPTDLSYVLRGVGWRGGAYTDLPDLLPLTGAATSDLRAPHPAFYSNTFYPVRPWNINYFETLGGTEGQTRLGVMLSQYKSSSPASLKGTLRRFDDMNFRLYYSSNRSSYPTSDPNWTNTPALAAPPNISTISSAVSPDGSTVSFDITVIGDPSAGIQEVWIVYSGETGNLYGAWLPLDLTQDPADSRHWIGTLSIGDTPAAEIRFVVQAVNGVGLVTMMTNLGDYYRIGVDPGAPPEGQIPVTLTLTNPETSGAYGSTANFAATATYNGNPIAGIIVIFRLGQQSRLAVTGNDGVASTDFFLLANPGEYTLSANFEGDDTHQPASASSSFDVVQGTSAIILEPALRQVMYGSTLEYTAKVTSAGLPLALKPIALTLTSSGNTLYTEVVETDYAGQARWQVPTQAPGSYSLTAWFGQQVSTDLDLSNPYYMGASANGSLIVYPLNFDKNFSGFFSPVDNPPTVNKVKAGSSVPIKFSLGSYYGLDIFAPGYPSSSPTQCKLAKVHSINETVGAAKSQLIYNPLTNTYTYSWKTDKKWAGSCRILTLKFIDGTTVKIALFQFTK